MKSTFFLQWKYLFSFSNALKHFLGAFGFLWLFIEALAYFEPETVEPLRNHLSYFLIISLVWSLYKSWPSLNKTCKMGTEDTNIEIRVGDILKLNSDIVIPSNSTFDTDYETPIIGEKSLQANFSERYYKNIKKLDDEIDAALQGFEFDEIERTKGKTKRYPIGTVAKLKTGSQVSYWLAMSHTNETGGITGGFDEVQTALNNLWPFIRSHGIPDQVSIGAIGTRNLDLGKSREDMIYEIIDSFIRANKDGRVCEKLSIIIYTPDFAKHNMNLKELFEYLSFACKYSAKRALQT